jgi:hypothetical protein
MTSKNESRFRQARSTLYFRKHYRYVPMYSIQFFNPTIVSLPRGATRAAPKLVAAFPLFSSPGTPPPKLAAGMVVQLAGMVAAMLSSSCWWCAPQQANRPSLAWFRGVDEGGCCGCGSVS